MHLQVRGRKCNKRDPMVRTAGVEPAPSTRQTRGNIADGWTAYPDGVLKGWHSPATMLQNGTYIQYLGIVITIGVTITTCLILSNAVHTVLLWVYLGGLPNRPYEGALREVLWDWTIINNQWPHGRRVVDLNYYIIIWDGNLRCKINGTPITTSLSTGWATRTPHHLKLYSCFVTH